MRDWIAQPPDWSEIVQVRGDAIDAASDGLDIGEHVMLTGTDVVRVVDFGIATQCAFALVSEVD